MASRSTVGRGVAVVALALMLSVGCGGGMARGVRPTETVRILGESSDAIGRLIERDADGRAHVELHEGPSVWVEGASVSALSLAPSTFVVARDGSGALFRGTVTEVSDRIVTVTDERGQPVMVALGQILATLHHGSITTAIAIEPPPPPPPPPDVRTYAVHAGSVELWETARLAACSAAGARIIGSGTSLSTVPARDVMRPTVAVGDRVGARWQDGETPYPAIVIGTEGALFRVHYEDGSEELVRASQISWREAPMGVTGGCPRGGDETVLVRRGRMSHVLEVVSCASGTATTRVPGETAVTDVPLTELTTLAVAAGARIDVLWHQSSHYTGVAGATHDGSVDVRYDDGSEELTPLTDLRWIAGDPVGEPYRCVAAGN